jgi:hypothetical protein
VQTIAHGLGAIPTKVLVSIYDNTIQNSFIITEGVHDATYLRITVTANVKYKVLAFE